MRRPFELQSKKREAWIGAMEIQPYPEIMEYTAILMDGRKVKNSVTSINWLETHLHYHGSHTLRKLILCFIHPNYHRYYYPYANHNIVLEQLENNQFHIQFYHYYNVKNERIDIPVQQQYYDYFALEHFLFQHPILYYSLYGCLLTPSFEWYHNPVVLSSPPFISPSSHSSPSSPSSPSSHSSPSPPSPPPTFQGILKMILNDSIS